MLLDRCPTLTSTISWADEEYFNQDIRIHKCSIWIFQHHFYTGGSCKVYIHCWFSVISCLENEISLPASYFSVHLSLCDQNVASYIFANMCNVHVDSLAHFRALKPSFLRSISGWLDGRTEISGRPYSESTCGAYNINTVQVKKLKQQNNNNT